MYIHTPQHTDRPKARLLNPMSSFFQKKLQQANTQLLKRSYRETQRRFGPSRLLNLQPIIFRWVMVVFVVGAYTKCVCVAWLEL